MQSLVLDVEFSQSVWMSRYHLQIVPRHELISLCRMYWNESHTRKRTTGTLGTCKLCQTNLPAYGTLRQMRSMRMRSAWPIALKCTCVTICDHLQALASFRKCLTVCSGLRLMGLWPKAENIARGAAGAMRLCWRPPAINKVCKLSPSCRSLFDLQEAAKVHSAPKSRCVSPSRHHFPTTSLTPPSCRLPRQESY
jgi:hypothetical protein